VASRPWAWLPSWAWPHRLPQGRRRRRRGTTTGSRVIADHLGNPRGLAPAPGGGLYLAEAGSGGTVCVGGGEQGTTCVAKTGSFGLVTMYGVKRIVTGLVSGSGEGTVAAEGPVSVSPGPDGTFFGLFGLNAHVVPLKGTVPETLRAAALVEPGHLVRVSSHHPGQAVRNVGGQDWAWTSTRVKLAPESLPEPTCLVRGPAGALYVGELLGGFYGPPRPHLAGRARPRTQGLGHRPDHRAGLRLWPRRRVLRHRV
jgi:hypothetical protein